jgi:hypothetical protein
LEIGVLGTCCKTLFGGMTSEQYHFCDKQCENNKTMCCESSCWYNVTGVYKNGQFYAVKLSKTYNFGPDETLKLWMPVIEKSIKRCQKLSNFLILNKTAKHDLILLYPS